MDSSKSNQLALINFNDMPITIYGTQEDPLFDCYEKLTNANWFRKMREDNRFVISVDSTPTQYLTEIGLYKALMKSNRPIAEEFQFQVCQLLKQLRIKQKKQLEQANKEIEYFNSLKKIGFIYRIQHRTKKNKFYVGLTEYPMIEMRFKDHKETALQSLKLQLYREIFKEGLKNYEIIEIDRVEYIDWQELKDKEDYWIDSLKPPLNNGYQFKCPCGVERKQHIATKTHKQQCLIYKQYKKGQTQPCSSMI